MTIVELCPYFCPDLRGLVTPELITPEQIIIPELITGVNLLSVKMYKRD